jgi:aspartokinase
MELSFDEAAELAYFGAKILHPTCILPAQKRNIPVLLKNTMQPEAFGTVISDKHPTEGIKAVAAKDGICAINIKSDRMLLAHGFLRAVFEIFERYKTSIDMITTSEIAVSLTIDNLSYLNEIKNELEEFSRIHYHKYAVVKLLSPIIQELIQRASVHDDSKFEDDEFPGYVKAKEEFKAEKSKNNMLKTLAGNALKDKKANANVQGVLNKKEEESKKCNKGQ